MDDALGPDEGACGLIVAVDETGDVVSQLADIAERCALERLGGQNGEYSPFPIWHQAIC